MRDNARRRFIEACTTVGFNSMRVAGQQSLSSKKERGLRRWGVGLLKDNARRTASIAVFYEVVFGQDPHKRSSDGWGYPWADSLPLVATV